MASKYKKLTPIDHVLLRPEMYVGSVECQATQLFLFDKAKRRMVWTTVNLNHGLLKIVDEIVLNAADNIHSSKATSMTYIAVTIDKETGTVSVENDGAGIPVTMSREYKLLVPEMIFGHLLTSSNYDNDPDSTTAGRHGYGAKLTNIMSTTFTVYCRTAGKEVTIVWKDHMKTMEPHLIKTTAASGNITRITFKPDYSLFGLSGLEDDMYGVLVKRIVDLAASFPSVKVTINGDVLDFSDFSSYAQMYQGEDFSQHTPYVFESKQLRLAFVPNPQPSVGRRSVSVINGVVTYSGGTHASAAQDVLSSSVDHMAAQLKKDNNMVVNTASFLRHFTTIILLQAPQPKFDSQSKVRLVSKVKLPRVPTTDIIAFLAKMPFIETTSKSSIDVLAKEMNQLVQANRKKPLISSLTKLVDAASASSKRGQGEIRTLIVTEGDSAKALALNSLSNEQRKSFGVFPLRGKLLNVRNNNLQRLRKCKELCDLFAALGIEIGKKYASPQELRYQRILIMTDQDADGTHIKGLLISAFESLWPSLLQSTPGFLSIFSTPLIRVTTRGGDVVSFYSKKEYLAWVAANPLINGTAKYYKGLGTSTTAEGKEYFSDMARHVMQVVVREEDRAMMDNVFDSDEVQWRKDWLTSKPVADDIDLDRGQTTLTIPQFVEKELIHFAVAGNLRALPSAIDGLKPSQRKILWACFKRGLTQSTKVAQLSGYISEVSAFHHGEMSLQQTIVKMAQDFVGGNNVNLLLPEGQFGSRQHAGGDHAAARYIFTRLSPMARHLFPKEDDELLEYVEDEGKSVEPRYYVPVLPMLLVNGSVGIGFGFASTVQPHHPLDVATVVRRMLGGAKAEEALVGLHPWAVGFSGTVRINGPNSWTVAGRYTTRKVKEFDVVRVEELPWDTPIELFRLKAGKLAEDGSVLRFADYSGANHVDADVVLAHGAMKSSAAVERELALTSNISNNATVYSPEMVLSPVGSELTKIVEWHYEQRLRLYEKRKERQLQHMKRRLRLSKSTLLFTEKVRNNEVDFRKVTDDGLVALCVQWKVERDDDETFDYLLKRPITYFTNTNVEKLQRDIVHISDDIKSLEARTPVDLWEADLAVFEKAFAAAEQEIETQIATDRRKPFAAPPCEHIAQVTDSSELRRKKKSLGGGKGHSGGGMLVAPASHNTPLETPVNPTAKVSKFVASLGVAAVSQLVSRVLPRLLL